MFKKLAIATLLSVSQAAHSVLDYGNVTSSIKGVTPSYDQQVENKKAIEAAINAANADQTGDRTFLVPKGTKIETMPLDVRDLKDVTIDIQGDILATSLWEQWPIGKKAYINFWEFTDCDGLTFQSNKERSGKIDGQGYMWWIREIL